MGHVKNIHQFLCQEFCKIESFGNSLEYDGTAMVKRMKDLFSDNVKIETLKDQLAFIAGNRTQLKIAKKNERKELLVSKNPDLETFKVYAGVLMGNCFQTGSTLEKPLKFKNAPMASAEIERVFSKMSAILTPQRPKLTFDSLKFHLIINWNAEDINNDDNNDDCE